MNYQSRMSFPSNLITRQFCNALFWQGYNFKMTMWPQSHDNNFKIHSHLDYAESHCSNHRFIDLLVNKSIIEGVRTRVA